MFETYAFLSDFFLIKAPNAECASFRETQNVTDSGVILDINEMRLRPSRGSNSQGVPLLYLRYNPRWGWEQA